MSTSISSLNLLGGVPLKSQDFAASIIFAAVFVALTGVGIFRMVMSSSRSPVLIRPLVFSTVRVATYILRALIANKDGQTSSGLYIADLVLLLAGFPLICEPLLVLTLYHTTRYDSPSVNKTPERRIQTLLRLALIAALVLGIVAASKYSDLSDPSSIKAAIPLRNANAIICLVITALTGAVVVMLHSQKSLPFLGTCILLVISALLTIVSIYKVVLYEASSPNQFHAGTKAAFYLLSSVPEALATACFFAFNVNETFDAPLGRKKAAFEKKLEKAQKKGIPLPVWSEEEQRHPSESEFVTVPPGYYANNDNKV